MDLYDFLQTSLIVQGVEMTAYMSGDDVIQIARRQDSGMDIMGASGTMVQVNNPDKSGTFTFKLLQTSKGNKVMSGLLALQEAGAGVPILVSFRDSISGDIATGVNGYIKRISDMSRGVNVNGQEWAVVVERLDLTYGS